MLSRFIETVAGDTLSFRIVLRDGASPVDVSEALFSGGVKESGSEVDMLDFEFKVVPNSLGVVRVTLTPEQTILMTNPDKLYQWYVRIENGDYKKTLGFGAIKVTKI